MFFKWHVLGKGGVDDVGLEQADSSDNAVSVAMAHWNVEHRVFAIEQFFRNSDSVVTVQRLFRQKYNVERRGAIPDRNTVLRWVEEFKCFNPSELSVSIRNCTLTLNIELSMEKTLDSNYIITVSKKTARRQTHDALCSNAPWLLKRHCLSCPPAHAQHHQPHSCRVLAI